MTDLQIEYMFELQHYAKVPHSLAKEWALRNDIDTMKLYVREHISRRSCGCENNGDLCSRCERIELLNKF
jgi:hypothetical protein